MVEVALLLPLPLLQLLRACARPKLATAGSMVTPWTRLKSFARSV